MEPRYDEDYLDADDELEREFEEDKKIEGDYCEEE